MVEATHGGTSLVDTSPKAGRRLGALTILALMALTALVGGEKLVAFSSSSASK